MVEEIQEKLQEQYSNLEIEVEYLEIRKYKITLIKYTNTILKDKKNNDIIKKSVTFEYNWQNNFTFSSNIEQIKSIINTYLEREEKRK